MHSDHLSKSKSGRLELYQAIPKSSRADERSELRPAAPKFVKIKDNPHNFEVHLRILILLTPLIILFIRVYFYNIPLLPDRSKLIPGLGLNLFLFAIGGACLLPLMFIIGHDEDIMARLNEQWCLILKDEIIFVKKFYFRIFIPFQQTYYVESFERGRLRRIEFVADSGWRRAGGACFNPDVAARFISWELRIQAQSGARITLGDISYESAAELHRLIQQWISEDTELKPLPPKPA